MKPVHLLGIVFLISLAISVTNVAATTGKECRGTNLYTNYTIDGTEVIVTTECPNSCIPIDGGRFVCQTVNFFIPLELYIALQLVAFALMAAVIYLFFKEDNGSPLVLNTLAMILFFALAIMSFSMGGIVFIAGAVMNASLGLLMLVYVMTSSIPLLVKKPRDE
jgi:hypothetical protein